jgi:hypothetical protein
LYRHDVSGVWASQGLDAACIKAMLPWARWGNEFKCPCCSRPLYASAVAAPGWGRWLGLGRRLGTLGMWLVIKKQMLA